MNHSSSIGAMSSGLPDMDKLKTLESTISQIERSFGKGSVMKLGEKVL